MPEAASTEDFSQYNGDNTELREAQLRLLDILVEFDRICTKHNIHYFLSGGSCLGAIRHQGFIPWDDDIDVDVWHSDYDKLVKVLPRELADNYFMQTPRSDKSFYRLYMKLVDKNSHVVYSNGDKARKAMAYKGLSIDILPLKNVLSYRAKKLIDRIYKPAFVVLRTGNRGRAKMVLASCLYPCMQVAVGAMTWLDEFASKEKVSHSYGTGMAPELTYSQLFPTQEVLFEGRYFPAPARPHEYLTYLYGDYMAIPGSSNRESHAVSISIFGKGEAG